MREPPKVTVHFDQPLSDYLRVISSKDYNEFDGLPLAMQENLRRAARRLAWLEREHAKRGRMR